MRTDSSMRVRNLKKDEHRIMVLDCATTVGKSREGSGINIRDEHQTREGNGRTFHGTEGRETKGIATIIQK